MGDCGPQPYVAPRDQLIGTAAAGAIVTLGIFWPLYSTPFLGALEVQSLTDGMPGRFGRFSSAGAMGRRTFDDAVSALRHSPGVVRPGIAAGPINGQAALDASLQVGANSTRRIGIDYAQRQFVVLDEHAASMFHGHVRSWDQLTQQMQAVLRRAGMVDRRGNIIIGD